MKPGIDNLAEHSLTSAPVPSWGNHLNLPSPSDPIVILGAGVTGLTLGRELLKVSGRRVIIVEKAVAAGGLAGSISFEGRPLDLGSHRIHPGYEPRAMAYLRALLGDNLLSRPRRGEIRIQGRFLNYPPSPWQILGSLPRRERVRAVAGFAASQVHRVATAGRRSTSADFEAYARARVGDPIYRRFYFPYAKKLWGLPPHELSFEPAMGRVKKFSMKAVAKDAIRKIRSDRNRSPLIYHYPKRGFGEIPRTLLANFLNEGGESMTSTAPVELVLDSQARVVRVRTRTKDGFESSIPCSVLLSTLPIDAMAPLLASARPEVPLGTTSQLGWRSLRIVYARITGFNTASLSETFYFPEPDVIFGRLSLPDRYLADDSSDARSLNTLGRLLSFEIPCDSGDPLWEMSDQAIAEACLEDCRKIGLTAEAATLVPTSVLSVRLPNVYPIHKLGWKQHFKSWMDLQERHSNLYSVGRSALFLHCNVDHCIAMALDLCSHLSDAGAKGEDWRLKVDTYSRLALHD